MSTFKRIVLVTGAYFIMTSSLLSKDMTVTKCPPVIRTNLFKNDSSLPPVDDTNSFTRARNVLASLITSIESLEPPSYWYANYLDLDCLFLSIIKTCSLIR